MTNRRNRRVPFTKSLASMLVAVLFALSMGVVSAQEADAQDQDQTQDQTQTQTQDQDTSAAEQVDPNEPVIEVGAGDGDPITQQEFQQAFDRAMRTLAAQQGIPYNEQTQALFDRFRADFLNQYATQQALIQEAEERGITVTDEQVTQQVDRARQAFGGDDQFQQGLQELGYENVEAYRQAAREGLLAQGVVDELSTNVQVTDEQIQTFYDENQEQFGDQTLEQVRPQIETQLTNQQLSQQFEELRSQYGIQTYPERLQSISDPEGLSRSDLENREGGAEDPEGNMGATDDPADDQAEEDAGATDDTTDDQADDAATDDANEGDDTNAQ